MASANPSSSSRVLILCFLLNAIRYGNSFAPASVSHNGVVNRGWQPLRRGCSSPSGDLATTQLTMINPAVANILAGSLAGAIGVGVAFPLDTLKTKAQVMGQQLEKAPAVAIMEQEEAASMSTQSLMASVGTSSSSSSSSSSSVTAPISMSSSSTSSATAAQLDLSMPAMVILIWKAEGFAGFFSGVRGMMVGQAFVKAMAFSANNFALTFLREQHEFAVASGIVTLILAACFSGFVTSFIVAPVERIKVMMQASGKSLYKNEFHCAEAVIRNEGWEGLFGRGLGATIAREVPSYGIYFVVYSLLMQTAAADLLGGIAPLVFGAMSGCACWLPVYPVDVVKTLLQNTEGENGNVCAWDVVRDLYAQGGVGAFFDGLTPKMLRAAVNHAVTFWIYSIVMGFIAV